MSQLGWVNARLSASILPKLTFPINLYNIFFNYLNGHGCYFFKYYNFNL
jgi:hypothetical protein